MRMVICKACGSSWGFYERYQEPVKPFRFLWWKREAKPAYIELTCMSCGFVTEVPCDS